MRRQGIFLSDVEVEAKKFYPRPRLDKLCEILGLITGLSFELDYLI